MAVRLTINFINHLPDLAELYLTLDRQWDNDALISELNRLITENKLSILISPKYSNDKTSYLLEPSLELLKLMARVRN